MSSRPVVLLMGGSFDPVHVGHVALAGLFVNLLAPDVLRLIPAGDPWQKAPLAASAADRIAMLRLAFANQPVPVDIDEQEIRRSGGSYTIETLRALRAEFGDEASLAWIIGADQLERFDTWRDWRSLFDLAHFCVGARPGYSIDAAKLPKAVATAFHRRQASPAQIRDCAHGLTLFAANLWCDISSTEVRAALARGENCRQYLSPPVLDYVAKNHLYQT